MECFMAILGLCLLMLITSSHEGSGAELPMAQGNACSVKTRRTDYYQRMAYTCTSCANAHINPSTTSLCVVKCAGVRCHNDTCKTFNEFGRIPECGADRKAINGDYFDYDRNVESNVSQVPVVVGFVIGGIVLIGMIAGIFIAKNTRMKDDGSDIITTPMSWNLSRDSSGKGHLNSVRVEEVTGHQQNGNAKQKQSELDSPLHRHKNNRPSSDKTDAYTIQNSTVSRCHGQQYDYESSPLAEGIHILIEDQDLIDDMGEDRGLLNYSYDSNCNCKPSNFILASNYNSNDKYSQPIDTRFNPSATVIDEQYWNSNVDGRPRCFSAMEHTFPMYYDPENSIAYRTKNLTYVVVDVHKNMQLSTEELGSKPVLKTTQSGSLLSTVTINKSRGGLDIFTNGVEQSNQKRVVDYLSLSPRKSVTDVIKFNYVDHRSTSLTKHYLTCPRMVRLASAGSGEYALPVDAIV